VACFEKLRKILRLEAETCGHWYSELNQRCPSRDCRDNMATVAPEIVQHWTKKEQHKISLIEPFDPEFCANFASPIKNLPPLDRLPSETL
jgi:hypothetical protein